MIYHISIVKDDIHFHHYRERIQDPIRNDWNNIDEEEFYEYRKRIYIPGEPLSDIILKSTIRTPTSGPIIITLSKNGHFQITVNRDVSLYPKLNYIRKFYYW